MKTWQKILTVPFLIASIAMIQKPQGAPKAEDEATVLSMSPAT